MMVAWAGGLRGLVGYNRSCSNGEGLRLPIPMLSRTRRENHKIPLKT